jgi:hypothetical protein
MAVKHVCCPKQAAASRTSCSHHLRSCWCSATGGASPSTGAKLTLHITRLGTASFSDLRDILLCSPGQHSTLHDYRLVLENSGVAEPHAIRDRFTQATEANRPLMQRLRLDTLVTVCPACFSALAGCAPARWCVRSQRSGRPGVGNPHVHAAQVLDCSSFLADYSSRAPVMARPELGEGGNLRPVVDLLVEQLECVPHCCAGTACTACLRTGAAAGPAPSRHRSKHEQGAVWHVLVTAAPGGPELVCDGAGVLTMWCSTRPIC